jgi:hypothetical protein
MQRTYHVVIVLEDGNNLLSSDLFINNLEKAQEHFKKKIKEENPLVLNEDLERSLDEGWFKTETVSILLTEPYNVFGED